jgi:GrpB-like predicted nucleotidyltransferase (UPF0157 family)
MSSREEDAPIVLTAYDPAWLELFERERVLLAEILAPWLVGPIEHIGSTAVVGMPAKPVIDIMAAVDTLETSRDAILALSHAGYCYAPYRCDIMHWFCKPSPAMRTHHLHLVPLGSQLWADRLCFRDALRSDRDLAQQYLQLKQRLAASHKTDREAYTDGKTDFIARALGSSKR